ncbi:MAG: carbohydrate ABC transporter permease [Nitrospirota bacterium]|nr:carbohydrate ABC transporter permease [Nitrospirota bacterium]MEC4687007.1 carbohydrate ABC transporter permease [Nitrospirota bacterium]
MTRRILLGVGILLTVGLSLFPFLWFVVTSLKTQKEVEAIPPTWWPSGSLDFYQSALVDHHLTDYILNSVLVAGSTTLLALGIGIPAAYALARLRLPGKVWILGALLSISMFPQLAIAGPVWQILERIGGLNTRWGLLLPYVTLTLPLTIWILASFFKELPEELEEAARVDGCGPWQTMIRVMVPLAAPAIFTAAILTFIYAWNEFFFALLILTQPERQTLPVGIALFQGEFTMPWGELAAASVIATLPLVILVVLFQRWIVSGLSAGAVKG